MNTKYLIVALLLIMTRDAFAQSTDNGSLERGEHIDSNDTAADIKRLSLSPEENLKAREAEFIKSMAERGYKVGPVYKGSKNAFDDYFTIPRNERLTGCIYTKGYSYPDICIDDNNKVVFNYNKGDDQKILDKIIKAQGKQGKYNKLPKVRRVYKDAEVTITIVKEHPPQVIVPPPPSEDDDEEEQ